MSLIIDIISDVVCPWCFIGKRKLAQALDLYRIDHPGESGPQLRWHPFQLNPEMPPGGIDRDEYVRTKFGDRGSEIYARVAAAGTKVGIPFAFDKVGRQPNTLAAHGLIALAEDAGLQDEVVEALFLAYFIDGLDLTSNDTLSSVAVGAGLQAEEVKRCLEGEEARAHVRSEEEMARSLGVEGVPFFIFNRRVAVSGAQDPEVLLRAMLQSEAGAGG